MRRPLSLSARGPRARASASALVALLALAVLALGSSACRRPHNRNDWRSPVGAPEPCPPNTECHPNLQALPADGDAGTADMPQAAPSPSSPFGLPPRSPGTAPPKPPIVVSPQPGDYQL